MTFLFKYIKSKLLAIILFIICCLFFIITFAFYHLPIQAVIYPAVLCVPLLVAFAAFDLLRCLRKHKQLVILQKLPENMLAVLERYNSANDDDYREIVKLLIDRQYTMRTKMSGRLSDMLDYYTTWVHQIKTPIASMRLTLQSDDTPISRKLSDDLMRIEQYVEMVLCYLRLDSDSTDYVFKEYELDDIVKQAVRRFAPQFIMKNIRLVYEPLNTRIVTDEKWLLFVIEQLLSNSLKYTNDGYIKISLLAPTTLCICDTGIGIAATDLPRIFEKGYTGHNGRADKRASGLGLYLCKRICSNLGHKITAESEISVGTTIKLCLEKPKTRH